MMLKGGRIGHLFLFDHLWYNFGVFRTKNSIKEAI